MKNIRYALLFIASLSLTAAGCKKWLDVAPRTQTETEKLFRSEAGFQDAMYGVYTTIAGPSLYGDQLTMSFLDVLAQRYDCNTPSHIFNQAAVYNYQDNMVRQRIDNIWDTMYHAIVNLNNVLLHVDDKKEVFRPGNYELLKGEALGLRAFLHFDLLRLFGPSYLTGASKQGIPYLTGVSGGVTPMSTVAAVLDSVIAELNTASALLAGYKNLNYDYYDAENTQQNDWLNRRQNHFNYWAAEATLARAYLYKGDKQRALQHAQNVIGNGMLDFQDASRIGNLQDRTFIPEHIFALSKFDLRNQVLLYFQSSGSVNINSGSQLTNTYGTGSVVEELYEVTSGGVSDIRYARLWELSGSIYFNTKYWQTATNPAYANVVPLIRLPEMYYIAAECSDPATATGYLNEVRNARGLQPLPDGLGQAAVQNEIFKEYQKETYAEGQLFYYYKRLNMAQIRFTTIPGSDNIYVLPLPDDERQYRNN